VGKKEGEERRDRRRQEEEKLSVEEKIKTARRVFVSRREGRTANAGPIPKGGGKKRNKYEGKGEGEEVDSFCNNQSRCLVSFAAQKREKETSGRSFDGLIDKKGGRVNSKRRSELSAFASGP